MKANISDDQGLTEMLTNNIDFFKVKPEELPIKINTQKDVKWAL